MIHHSFLDTPHVIYLNWIGITIPYEGTPIWLKRLTSPAKKQLEPTQDPIGREKRKLLTVW